MKKIKILIKGLKGQLDSQIINILKKGLSELGVIFEVYKTVKIIGVDIEDLVFKVNSLGPRNLSISCKLVSLYGKTKLLGGLDQDIF